MVDSACLWSLNGSAGHIVFFRFMYKGRPSQVTYLLIPLLLGYYSTEAFFFHERPIYVSFAADFKPRCLVCQRDSGDHRTLIISAISRSDLGRSENRRHKARSVGDA